MLLYFVFIFSSDIPTEESSIFEWLGSKSLKMDKIIKDLKKINKCLEILIETQEQKMLHKEVSLIEI